MSRRGGNRMIPGDPIDELYLRVSDLEKEIKRVRNNTRPTVPIYSSAAFPDEAVNGQVAIDSTGSGGVGGGGGGIEEITSSDSSISITNPTGPIVDLITASGGGSTAASYVPHVMYTGNTVHAYTGWYECIWDATPMSYLPDGPFVQIDPSNAYSTRLLFQLGNYRCTFGLYGYGEYTANLMASKQGTTTVNYPFIAGQAVLGPVLGNPVINWIFPLRINLSGSNDQLGIQLDTGTTDAPSGIFAILIECLSRG